MDNLKRVPGGALENTDSASRDAYLRQRDVLAQRERLKDSQINTLTAEVDELKTLVKKLLEGK
jgi:hypothetical protein